MRQEFTHQNPEPSRHACDAPDISPIEFMLAVMRDTTLPLAIRLDAASKVAPFYHRRLRSQESNPHCTIVIPPLSYEPWSHICSPWPRSTGNVLPFTEPRPASIPSPHCTIVIPPLPNDHGSVAQDPASVHRILQSSSVGAELSHQPLSGDESQSNIETTSHPLFFDAPSCIEDHLETTFANAPKALLEKLKAEALSNPNPDYSTPPTPQELAEIKAAINKLRPDLAHLPIPEFHLCPCGHWITGEYDCCRALSSRDPSKMN